MSTTPLRPPDGDAVDRLRSALDALTAEVADRPVPDDRLAEARRQAVASPVPASRRRLAPVWVAAACLALLVAVVAVVSGDGDPVERTGDDPTTTMATTTTAVATTEELPLEPAPSFRFDLPGATRRSTGDLPGGSGDATMWRARDGSALVSVGIGRVHPTFERDMVAAADRSALIDPEDGTAYFTPRGFEPADLHPSVQLDWVHPDQTLWRLEAHWPPGADLTDAEMRAQAERWLLALGPDGTTLDDPAMEAVLTSVPNRSGGRFERWEVDGVDVALYVGGGAAVTRLGLMMDEGGWADPATVGGHDAWRATFGGGMVVLGIASAPVDGDWVTITIPPAIAHREAEIAAAFQFE